MLLTSSLFSPSCTLPEPWIDQGQSVPTLAPHPLACSNQLVYNRVYRPVLVGIPRARASTLSAAPRALSLASFVGGLRPRPACLPAEPHPVPTEPVHPSPGASAGPGQSGERPGPHARPDRNPVVGPPRLPSPAAPPPLFRGRCARRGPCPGRPAPGTASIPRKIRRKPSPASLRPLRGRRLAGECSPFNPPSAPPPRRCPHRR